MDELRVPDTRVEDVEDSPRALIDARGAGGGTMEREDAEGGTTARPALAVLERPLTAAGVAVAAAAFPVWPFRLAEEDDPLDVPELFAAAAAGTLELTKRCSFASYTIDEPLADMRAVALESTLRAIRDGAATLALADVMVSRGASFSIFHFVAGAMAVFSIAPLPGKGITP
jgi:hypothetical protein